MNEYIRLEPLKHIASSTAITGLVNRIICGDVEDLRVRRRNRDRHDGLALFLTAKGEEQE